MEVEKRKNEKLLCIGYRGLKSWRGGPVNRLEERDDGVDDHAGNVNVTMCEHIYEYSMLYHGS